MRTSTLTTQDSTGAWLAAMMVLAACACGAPSVAPEPEIDSTSATRFAREAQDAKLRSTSVGMVSEREIEQMRVTRIEELLRGRLSGVEVLRRADGDLSVRVRGGEEPLFIVDGMPVPRGSGILSALAGVSPSDIARIEVVKDATAAAMYGAEAVYGVILIRTKTRR